MPNYTQFNPDYQLLKRKSPIPMAVTPRALFKILHKINSINSLNRWHLTALSAFMYLTGARISEALAMKVSHIEEQENGVYIVNLKTLKSKIYPLRRLPISPAKSDKPFYRIFKNYLDSIGESDEGDFLFPFSSRYVVNNLLKKVYTDNILHLDHINKKWIERPYRMHPHYFRHCRLSHLASVFGFGEIELMKFAGWSSTRPAIFYVKISYKDILNKMVSADVVSEYIRKFMGGNIEK